MSTDVSTMRIADPREVVALAIMGLTNTFPSYPTKPSRPRGRVSSFPHVGNPRSSWILRTTAG